LAPTISHHNLFQRSEGGVRIYYVSREVAQLLNVGEGMRPLRIVSAGMKMFERVRRNAQDICDYRISQDGVKQILPHLGAQVIDLVEEDVIRLLETTSVLLHEMKTPDVSLVCQSGQECEETEFSTHTAPSQSAKDG